MVLAPLYADWPEGARRSWGFGALTVLVAGFGLAVVVSGLVIVILAVADLVRSGVDLTVMSPKELREVITDAAVLYLWPGLLVQFLIWFLVTLFWVKVFEKRSMASLGIGGRGFADRYLLGLVLGGALVGLVGAGEAAISALFGVTEISGQAPDYARAFNQAALVGYAGLLAFFLFQGGVEEFIFRGWLMSTLTARWGKSTGVFVASFIFAFLHLHVFVSGLVYGVLALSAIGFTGLVFGLLALWRRSIVEVIAAHGAFNAVVFITLIIDLLATDDSHDFNSAMMEVLYAATGTAGAENVTLDPESWVQLVVMGGLSIVLLVGLKIRGRKKERLAHGS